MVVADDGCPSGQPVVPRGPSADPPDGGRDTVILVRSRPVLEAAVYPHQAVAKAPTPWQQEFAPAFAWLAEHDPAYFTQLTWAQVRQQETVLAMLHGWLAERDAHAPADVAQIRESLVVITLAQEHHAGRIDRDQLIGTMVDLVRPPWADRPLALAFAEVDRALGDEVGQISDVYELAGWLSQVFDRDTGLVCAQWTIAATG
ncbi:hypothetical protein AWW66_18340 [Micromonospora rosaria]|uniref:Uncharacterized protein n=2 Tax=Micromonospora rosaria TaxID=47874 RepID=A0A136PPZ3_9ACTN|nr:hypothetical protein AWW66_18340 [Micromonospora rosaria]